MDLEFIIFVKLYRNMMESLNFPLIDKQQRHMRFCIKISKSYMTYVWFGDFFCTKSSLGGKNFRLAEVLSKNPRKLFKL